MWQLHVSLSTTLDFIFNAVWIFRDITCGYLQLQQQNLQTMQDLYERRQAALDYYRQQYEQQHPHQDIVVGRNSSGGGEDEIDSI